MLVNHDIEYVSMNKKEEDYAGVTQEPVKSLLLLRQEKSTLFYFFATHETNFMLIDGYFLDQVTS